MIAARKVLVCAPAVWLLAAALCCAEPASPWFGDLPDAAPPAKDGGDTADEMALLRHVADRVFRQGKRVAAMPERFRKDAEPRIVFISVSDGHAPAQVALGAGHGVAAAVSDAMSRLDLGRDGGRPMVWLKLDLVAQIVDRRQVVLWGKIDAKGRPVGLAFQRDVGFALLPEEVSVRGLMSRRQRLQWGALSRYVRARRPPSGPSTLDRLRRDARQTVYLFTTRGYFSDGRRMHRLIRGRRPCLSLSPETLLAAARAGGDYLVRAVGPDGRFAYHYLPGRNEVADDYNIVRHAGTVYAMLELYETTRDQALLRAAHRALVYLLRQARPATGRSRGAAVIVSKQSVKLGSNALAVVALAKYASVTGDRRYVPGMLKLAAWIRHVQRPGGGFAIHKQSYPDGRLYPFLSEYYPGEAILALVRTYEHDRRPEWLDAAERSARYLITVRDRGKTIAQVSHDHWLLIGLNELYRHRKSDLYLSRSAFIARAMLRIQIRGSIHPDWVGGYYIPPRSTPAAVRSEGLVASHRLLTDFGKESPLTRETAPILAGIERGIRFQLRTQFYPEQAMYGDDPQRCLGGFHRSLDDCRIRIDYVQHNISSILGYRGILLDRQRNR